MDGESSQCGNAIIEHALLVTPDGVEIRRLCAAPGCISETTAPAAWRIDLRDHLVFPGLVNAHDHLQLNAFPAVRFTEPFPNSYAWIEALQDRMADPAFAAVRAIPTLLRLRHGALKNLLCGATTVAHHDPYHPAFDDPAFPVRTLRVFGWSHSLGLGLSPAGCSGRSYGPPIVAGFAATPPEQPWIVHLAEGTDAIAAAELQELADLGCLRANTVLVHGVGLTEADVATVIRAEAGVVWCPNSNLALFARTLDPRRLAEAGRLALGSDSRLTGSRDLLCELRVAADCSDMAPAELMRLVTDAASQLLAMPEVGGLAIGQSADLVIVRDDGLDPHEALLALNRAEIRAVVRNGLPAIADPDFADWFIASGIAVTSVVLNGKPKLMAADLVGPHGAAELEPGLEIRRG